MEENPAKTGNGNSTGMHDGGMIEALEGLRLAASGIRQALTDFETRLITIEGVLAGTGSKLEVQTEDKAETPLEAIELAADTVTTLPPVEIEDFTDLPVETSEETEKFSATELANEIEVDQAEDLVPTILDEEEAELVTSEIARIGSVATPQRATSKRDFTSRFDWEQVLGGNWFVRIGAFALVLGIGFFLKMAFDNNWIGDAGKVSLGIITGLVLLGLGEFYYRRYPVWGQTVTVASIPVLYLSIYASFAFYDLISPLFAFTFMAMVTLTAGLLSLRHESIVMAILGIIGGFATPLLFAKAPVDEKIVLTYIEVLDLGILGLVIVRNWRGLVLTGQIGTLILFGFWYMDSFTPEKVLLAEAALTLFFLTFVGATTLFHVIWRREPEPENVFLIIWNAGQYFLISLGLLWTPYRDLLGAFALSLALFYGLVAYLSFRRKGCPIQTPVFSLSLALVFLTLAVPLQFNGGWLTVAWAAEGASLVWAGIAVRKRIFWLCGLALFPVVVLRLFALDTFVDIATFQPVFNERFLTFFICVVLLYFVSRLFWKTKGEIKEGEIAATVLVLLANFFSLLVLNLEVVNHYDRWIIIEKMNLNNDKLLALTLLWTVYATAVIAVGAVKRHKPVRLMGTVLLAVPVVKLFAFDVFMLDLGYRVVAFMTLGILLMVMGFLYARHGNDVKGFFFD